MVRYRRNFVVGGTYFFTVTLADRYVREGVLPQDRAGDASERKGSFGEPLG